MAFAALMFSCCGLKDGQNFASEIYKVYFGTYHKLRVYLKEKLDVKEK